MPTLRKDLKQRDLEAYENAYQSANVDETRGRAKINAALVRTAIEAGWIPDLTVEAMGDLTGREVARLANAINDLYQELTALDPL